MLDRRVACVVMTEGERRAEDVAGAVQRFDGGSNERGFSGSERPGESDHVAGAQTPRERRSERA